jgi:non-homologous end joining protein Ku
MRFLDPTPIRTSSRTHQIESFGKAAEIDFMLLEKPCYLEPSGKGSDKVYALLRASMREAGIIGSASRHAHQGTPGGADPSGPSLILNTIRWARMLRRGNAPLPFRPPKHDMCAGVQTKPGGACIIKMCPLAHSSPGHRRR